MDQRLEVDAIGVVLHGED
ncbi:hypothetical protein, partial [Streptomyces prunicolor]